MILLEGIERSVRKQRCAVRYSCGAANFPKSTHLGMIPGSIEGLGKVKVVRRKENGHCPKTKLELRTM